MTVGRINTEHPNQWTTNKVLQICESRRPRKRRGKALQSRCCPNDYFIHPLGWYLSQTTALCRSPDELQSESPARNGTAPLYELSDLPEVPRLRRRLRLQLLYWNKCLGPCCWVSVFSHFNTFVLLSYPFVIFLDNYLGNILSILIIIQIIFSWIYFFIFFIFLWKMSLLFIYIHQVLALHKLTKIHLQYQSFVFSSLRKDYPFVLIRHKHIRNYRLSTSKLILFLTFFSPSSPLFYLFRLILDIFFSIVLS